MIARSLRLRLLAGAAAAIFAALTVAWLAMGYLFERHIERNLQDTLIRHGRDLVAGMSRDAAGALLIDPQPSDPRFALPASGLYWQAGEGAAAIRSRSLWDETLASSAPVATRDWSARDIAGPFESKLLLVARDVRLGEADAPVRVMVGADHSAISAARTEFSRDLAMFLLLLWAVLSAAAWAQVRLGLKPLDDVRAALDAMRRSPSERLEQNEYPTEAAPLALAINELAAARERDLEQARRRAGDLAHSLKTPLAALAAQSRRAREAGAIDAADGLDRAIEAARGAVERELARARAAAAVVGPPAVARTVVTRLIAVIERTEGGQRVAFENAASPMTMPVSEALLMEIAGPLLENAARFARTRVRIGGDASTLTIEDDGEGLDEAAAKAALVRGRRLDEGGPGDGLGLAIANDLVTTSGGTLALGRSDLGGLRVEARWRP
ncbi:sensor histidine kinase [alpha proteobacterium U9-1i]|nr:sensor histidine kinase [alpha proteobacterium U9-1i]